LASSPHSWLLDPRGGTSVGSHRAKQLAERRSVSLCDIVAMGAYFARHVVDKAETSCGSRPLFVAAVTSAGGIKPGFASPSSTLASDRFPLLRPDEIFGTVVRGRNRMALDFPNDVSSRLTRPTLPPPHNRQATRTLSPCCPPTQALRLVPRRDGSSNRGPSIVNDARPSWSSAHRQIPKKYFTSSAKLISPDALSDQQPSPEGRPAPDRNPFRRRRGIHAGQHELRV
jgi:hypothetical protein